ncbi:MULTISPECIES: MFS transporter [Rhodococcus]|uniref:MFS transporter n=1 Tax=Rhodococcus TaxID=1827 RepID=UPI001E5F3911|nr:MFS transporter [Rhodococcus pyridinivorans]MCD2118602.1 MHS family MFS transporter [Rhodococcus pyridinivorans]MCZ4627473.1 MFS transporter [Rhodococcus pyridinivorans]MCZ4649079.1 MFS transporter [Rhodococcus pyridinivorans]MDJ0483313.1 MFS transporter [Rhodococcus pyridinivorans]MDV7254789.1 MFS transporter [Rhodococcus pyridinivorans]
MHDTRAARRAGVTAFVGTTIEWFDFYIYGTASALVLGALFFPDASPAVGTLAAFATFAVGFIARPLGGIVFGHFGDRFGHKNAVIITLAFMGAGTIGVGLLPTYDQIGIWAPVLLVLLRVLQGIAMGGEWGGAVLIATEFAPPGKKVLYGAFAQQGSPVGNLLATLAFLGLTAMSDATFEGWGWRIPFLASAALVIVALYIRVRIQETPEMRVAAATQERTKLPLVEVLRSHPASLLLGVGAVVAGVAITYVKTTFALAWATTDLGFTRSDFLLVITLALAAQVLVQPFGAVLATRIDARRAVLWMLGPELVVLPLMFVLIRTGSLTWAIIGMVLATAPHAMYYSALAGILAQVFSTHVRYTGISLSYQISTAIFAGTAPMASQFLLERTDSIRPVVGLGPGYVLLSLVCMTALLKRSPTGTEPDEPRPAPARTTADAS